MIKWASKLSKFKTRYESRSTRKAQILADLIAEMTPTHGKSDLKRIWTLHVDRSSYSKGSGASLILENSEGLMVEVSLIFSFFTSNNQGEYEACIASPQLARDFDATRVELHGDSLLVVSQINEEFDAKDVVLQRYLAHVRELSKLFEHAEVKHVPQGENIRARNHWSVIQETVSLPSISLDAKAIVTICTVEAGENWITPILRYIKYGEETSDPKEAALARWRASSFSVIEGKYFRSGFSIPLLK